MPADRLVIASEERLKRAHIASPNLADHFSLVLHHATLYRLRHYNHAGGSPYMSVAGWGAGKSARKMT